MFSPNYAYHPTASRDALLRRGVCPLQGQVLQRFLLKYPSILVAEKKLFGLERR